jgi:hypothetical protein
MVIRRCEDDRRVHDACSTAGRHACGTSLLKYIYMVIRRCEDDRRVHDACSTAGRQAYGTAT